VNYGSQSTSLDIGYRWYQANGVTPLFAFGYGLSYSSFKLSDPTLSKAPAGVTVNLTVTNEGSRKGANVVQVYVTYPRSAGEPPEQLRGFVRVVLSPSSSRDVSLVIPPSGFQISRNGSFTTVPGNYGINIGQSSANLPLHLHVSLP
jgi:beta-glucosidase